MTEQGPTDLFADVARQLRAEPDETQTLERAIELAVEVIEGCDHAGVSIVRQGTIDTPAATSQEARRGDELQYALNEGPCLDSIHLNEVIHSPDLLTEQRWPRWAPQVACELGVRSMLCFRLFTTAEALGGLNLYSTRTNAFDDQDETVGLALAAHIAVALAASRKIDTRGGSIVTRTLIGQAQGILMERHGLTAEQAFMVLKRVSQEGNTKVAVAAAELIRTRHMPHAAIKEK
jgi:GAF domain-containing protein